MHKIITDADSAPSYSSAPPPNVEKQIGKLQCVLFVVFHTFLETCFLGKGRDEEG